MKVQFDMNNNFNIQTILDAVESSDAQDAAMTGSSLVNQKKKTQKFPIYMGQPLLNDINEYMVVVNN